MSLLPYIKYTLATNLTADEVEQRLADNIEPANNWRFSFGMVIEYKKPYEGKILNHLFKIRRIAWLNHKYRTSVRGVITELADGTSIDITIWLNWFCWVYAVAILLADLILIIACTSKALNAGNAALVAFFIIAFMNTIGVVFPFYAFSSESSKAKKFLSDLLEEKNDTQ